MGLFNSRKKNSSSIAKDRLKLVLIYDRAGTSSNNEMIQMLKRDILAVITKYIEIEEDELELDIKTLASPEEGMTSELVANIPIRKVKVLGKNKH